MPETTCGKCEEYICNCRCPGVTRYSKKCHLVSELWKTMGVMQQIIRRFGLLGEYSEALEESTASDWWPGPDPRELDDSSDVEDPEEKARNDLAEYKNEVANQEASFAILIAGLSVENNHVRLALERARMGKEDLHGQILRTKSSVPNRMLAAVGVAVAAIGLGASWHSSIAGILGVILVCNCGQRRVANNVEA